MVAHDCNSSTQETNVEELKQVQGEPRLHSENLSLKTYKTKTQSQKQKAPQLENFLSFQPIKKS